MALTQHTSGLFSGRSTYDSPWIDNGHRAFLVHSKPKGDTCQTKESILLQRHASLPAFRIQRAGLGSGGISGLERLDYNGLNQRRCTEDSSVTRPNDSKYHTASSKESVPRKTIPKRSDSIHGCSGVTSVGKASFGDDSGGSLEGFSNSNTITILDNQKTKRKKEKRKHKSIDALANGTESSICDEKIDHVKEGGCIRCSLTSRRELVERLESEPIFDYLVRNGVLDNDVADRLREEPSAAKRNLTVLQHVESKDEAVYGLFINALRQSGQHHLANLLDGSARIKALSGSGYLSKKRHKGQISLQIKVKALKLQEHKSGIDNITASFREWISLDDIRARIADLKEKQNQLDPLTLDMQDISIDEKKSSCFCHCFSRVFSRKKGEKGSKYITPPQPMSQKTSMELSNGLHTNSKMSDSQNSISKLRSLSSSKHSLSSLICIADILQGKADAIYAHLHDNTSAIHANLLRYFEQERGVLVLDTISEQHHFIIVNICPKKEQLEKLRRDQASGKLNRDVEVCLANSDGGEMLESVGAKAIKLHTSIDREQFHLAEQELG